MIVINEILPNPAGKDNKHEWIELYNTGPAAQNIAGWYFTTASGKKTYLQGSMGAGEYVVIDQSKYSFALRNKNEVIRLYGRNNVLQSEVTMTAQAPEQKSFSRTPDNTFVFTTPTSGIKNNIQVAATQTQVAQIPYNIPVNPQLTMGNAATLALATAIAVACAVVYTVRAYDIRNPLAQ